MKDLIKPLKMEEGKYEPAEVRMLEQDHREAIKALIDMCRKDEIHKSKFMAGIVSNVKRLDYIEIAEEATGQKWEVLKDLELKE